MDLRRRPRGRAVAVIAVAVIAVAAVAVALAVARRPAPLDVRTLRIPVADGPAGADHVLLDATFYTPAGRGRVPAILLAHGFAQTKAAVAPEAEQLARDGFAVLTWSARGFGASTGQIALDSPDYEVKDTEQLVSWLARQPRVELDGPGNPRVGIAGASYGGALALLAAAYDHRIDAVAAQSTWYNLATALFPDAAGGGPEQGVFKKQWAGLLFTAGASGRVTGGGTGGPAAGGSAGGATAAGGSAGGATAAGGSVAGGSAGGATAAGGGSGTAGLDRALCGRFLPVVCAMYQQVATLGRATPQAVALLTRSSPVSVAGRMRAPTLLIQGETDSLFGLDQANGNFQALRRNGAPVDMVWYAGGHDGGNQETGRITQLTGQWFSRWLRPGRHPAGGRAAATGMPAFAVSRELGFDPDTGQQKLGVATAAAYPGLGGTRRSLIRLHGSAQAVLNPPGGAPPSMSVLPGLGGGVSFDVPGQSASFTSAPLAAPLQVTGSPVARIRVSGSAAITLFAKLYDVDQAGNATLPFQLAAPLRVTGAARGAVVTVTLPAIDYQFAAGHRLRLVLSATDFAYATPARAAVYRVALAGRGVTVPLDPGLRLAGGGVPAWAWAAPLAALAAAAALLLVPSRRRSPGGDRAREGRRASLAEGMTSGEDVTSAEDVTFGEDVISGAVPAAANGVTAGEDITFGEDMAAGGNMAAGGSALAGESSPAGEGALGGEPALAGEPAPLEITGLTKRYRDGQLAVDGLSVRVERGQILGLLGPNGAGKTTTLRALMGLIHPDAGQITIFGQPVRPGAPALSRLGSFVEGPGFLPHLTGRANLDLYWRATGRPAATAHLAEVLEIAGLGPALDRRVRSYSRGMSQRLAIAQAMLGLPDLLVLDEPMNGLDPPQIREMRDVLLRYAAAGRTVVLSSHLLGEVEQTCSHVVVMNAGRRVAAGPVAQITGAPADRVPAGRLEDAFLALISGQEAAG